MIGLWLIVGVSGLGVSRGRAAAPLVLGIFGIVLALTISIVTGPFWYAESYANKIGPIETKTWTSDVQPKDVRQMRTVPEPTARYLARKAVSQAGSVGSQFNPSFAHMTLQQREGRMFYAVPLDYNGYAAWTSTEGSPGWIEIDARIRKSGTIHEGG